MTVFGFGRQAPPPISCCSLYMSAVSNVFSIGFFDDSTFESASSHISGIIYKQSHIRFARSKSHREIPARLLQSRQIPWEVYGIHGRRMGLYRDLNTCRRITGAGLKIAKKENMIIVTGPSILP